MHIDIILAVGVIASVAMNVVLFIDKRCSGKRQDAQQEVILDLIAGQQAQQQHQFHLYQVNREQKKHIEAVEEALAELGVRFDAQDDVLRALLKLKDLGPLPPAPKPPEKNWPDHLWPVPDPADKEPDGPKGKTLGLPLIAGLTGLVAKGWRALCDHPRKAGIATGVVVMTAIGVVAIVPAEDDSTQLAEPPPTTGRSDPPPVPTPTRPTPATPVPVPMPGRSSRPDEHPTTRRISDQAGPAPTTPVPTEPVPSNRPDPTSTPSPTPTGGPEPTPIPTRIPSPRPVPSSECLLELDAELPVDIAAQLDLLCRTQAGTPVTRRG